MFQDVLSEPDWRQVMKKEDYGGITPLVDHHVNPYGWFELILRNRMFSNIQPTLLSVLQANSWQGWSGGKTKHLDYET